MVKAGAAKTLLYAALALMVFLMSRPFGIQLSWALYATALVVLAILLLYADFERRSYDSRMISLLSVMTAVTVVSRQLIHGVEFSPVFFLAILTGYVFGFIPGFAVGSMAMLVSNFFVGQGPWTPFQMLGLGLTAAFAAYLPRPGKAEVLLLVLYSAATAYLYGAFMDVFFWITFVPAHTLESFIAVVGAGLFAATSRAVGNVFFMSLLGPALLRVLRRFERRFSCKYADG